MSHLPEKVRKLLLDGPITADRLFGPLLPDAVNRCLKRQTRSGSRGSMTNRVS